MDVQSLLLPFVCQELSLMQCVNMSPQHVGETEESSCIT